MDQRAQPRRGDARDPRPEGPVREVGAQVKLGQAAVRMAAGAGDVHSVEENLLNGGQRDAVALPEPAREPSD